MCNCCVIIISSSHHIIKSLYHQVIILESRHPDLFQLKQLIGGESRSDPFWFSERQQKLWKMWTCKDMLLSNIETMACCEKVQNIHFQDRKQFLKIKLLQMPSAVIVSSTVIFQTHIQPKFSETKRCDSRTADLNNAFTHKRNCWGADFNCARVSADPRDRS